MNLDELQERMKSLGQDVVRYKQRCDLLEHRVKKEQQAKHDANTEVCKLEARVRELEGELARRDRA